MKCPFCQAEDTKVVDSRPTEDDTSIRRRRLCSLCEQRFTTYERYERPTLVVIKKDKTRAIFDRSKVFNGMLRASEKRPVPVEAIEKAVDEIEEDLRQVNKSEIESIYIGELVMDKLRKIDKIAYIRYASVYREFEDVSGFYDELENLKKD